MERTIWFYWDQGWDDAPWFIKYNYLSWRHKNPDWRIVFLDSKNLGTYSQARVLVGPNSETISVTAFSDIVRLDLLNSFGGAWIDATLLCMASLTEWLPDLVSKSGFFSFRSGCVDRDLASWHIAAEAHNYLVSKWLEAAAWYWGSHKFYKPESRWPVLAELLDKYCNSREATEGFFTNDTLENKQVYPYFWVNYLHQRLIRQDTTAADIWSRTPAVSSGPASTFLEHDPCQPISDQTRTRVLSNATHMLKFDRRRMPESPPENSALDVLYGPLLRLPLPTRAEVMTNVPAEFARSHTVSNDSA